MAFLLCVGDLRRVWTDEEREYHAILLNTPQISPRTVGAEAMLMSGNGLAMRQTSKLWLTFSRDSLAETCGREMSCF